MISLTSYVLLIEVGYRLSLFHVIAPLYFFFLFSFKRAVLYTIIHQIIVISIYIYGYFTDSQIYSVLYSGNILSLTIASAVIIAFGVLYHITIEKYNQKIEIANYQKEILLNEIHHRIKNNLQMISNMLGLQQMSSKDKKLYQILEKNRLRIHSIATVHEILYKYESFEEIQFYDYTVKLTKTILDMYDSDAKVQIENNANVLPSKDIVQLGIITNELLINSIKHAFTDIDGKVEISLRKSGEYLVYRYKDNGQKEVNLQTEDSLGFKIVSMMVGQLEAELNLSTKKGIIFELKIPLTND
jgi:two-component sensor histidine kinase